ncbi:MAG: hypothetical protein M1839_009340 [Geoglossum umbratile]|nr:MAG: hypothetical protein M1839_009340 [Geoglossum umbratile]
MPHHPGHVASKVPSGPSGQSSVGGSDAQPAADPSGSRSQPVGDAPATGRSEAPGANNNGSDSPRTQGREDVPPAPHQTAASADATTAAGTNPVRGSKKSNNLLPSYTASANPPSRASADPCLSCVKRMDRSPGNDCPKVPHAACGRCTKAKRKCEPVPHRFRALARRVVRAASKVVASRNEVEKTPVRPRSTLRAAIKKQFLTERELRYQHAVFCRRVEAWQRKEALLRIEDQSLRIQEGIRKYLKVLARSHCASTKTPMPPDSEEEVVEEE